MGALFGGIAGGIGGWFYAGNYAGSDYHAAVEGANIGVIIPASVFLLWEFAVPAITTTVTYFTTHPETDEDVAEGFTRVYRAVSEPEYEQIVSTGQFQQGPNSFEGKWFADTLEGAQSHGPAWYPQGNFRIVEADVPNNAPSLYQQPNLDGFGPARFLHRDDLGNVTPRP